MPSAIQLDPALLAAGCWLWTGSTWIKASGDGTGRLNVNIGASTINVPVNIAASAITVPVSVQNWPGYQQVAKYPVTWNTITTTANGVIAYSGTYVHWVNVDNGAGSAGWVVLRNGTVIGAPVKLAIWVPASDSRCPLFDPPVLLNAGCYIEHNAATTRACTSFY